MEEQTEIPQERSDEEIKAMFAQANTPIAKKHPKWKGVIDVAVWENEDGSLYAKIGNAISVRLKKNE